MDYECRYRACSALNLSAEIAKMATCSEPCSSLRNFLTSSVQLGRQSHMIARSNSDTAWNLSNEKFYDRSMRERLKARKLKDDASEIVKSINWQTRQRQISSTQKLAVRISSISQWREELEKEILFMKYQRFDVDSSLAMIDKLLQVIMYPFQVSMNCIKARRRRIGNDASKDDVDMNLIKEVEKIKKWQTTLKGFTAKAENQNKTNKLTQDVCEKDLKNKTHAQVLDDEMFRLHNSSNKICPLPVKENSNLAMSHPFTWSRFTYVNIQKSRKERDKSQKLCSVINAGVKDCIDNIVKQYGMVNSAFKDRVLNLINAKNNFEMHLQQVKIQIQDQERMSEIIKKSILEKESPMKIVQTRLIERNKRIDMELCHDMVTNGLQSEVHELREAVRTLKVKLHSVQQSIEKLRKVQTTLEQEINVKENSLEIDSKFCIGIRKDMVQGFNSLTTMCKM